MCGFHTGSYAFHDKDWFSDSARPLGHLDLQHIALYRSFWSLMFARSHSLSAVRRSETLPRRPRRDWSVCASLNIVAWRLRADGTSADYGLTLTQQPWGR
jgi:hypothetical protein